MGADIAHARLPDGSASWLPSDQVGDVAEAQRHLRLCFAYGMAHIVWWEQVLHGNVEASWRAISHLADGLLQIAYAMATKCPTSQRVTTRLQIAYAMATKLLAPRFGTSVPMSICWRFGAARGRRAAVADRWRPRPDGWMLAAQKVGAVVAPVVSV